MISLKRLGYAFLLCVSILAGTPSSAHDNAASTPQNEKQIINDSAYDDKFSYTPTITTIATLADSPIPVVVLTAAPDQTATPTEEKSLEVILFGDSLTKGQDMFGLPLKSALIAALPGWEISVEAKGYSCQNIDSKVRTACGGMYDIPAPLDVFVSEILPLKPDYVLLWFGMNVASKIDVDSQLSSYSLISDQMRESGINPIYLTIIHDCGNSTHDQLLAELSSRITELGDEKNIEVIDVREFLWANPNSCSWYYSDDKMHLNRSGQDVVGDYIAKSLSVFISK
jgi:lysophospholipase L1-like esterase